MTLTTVPQLYHIGWSNAVPWPQLAPAVASAAHINLPSGCQNGAFWVQYSEVAAERNTLWCGNHTGDKFPIMTAASVGELATNLVQSSRVVEDHVASQSKQSSGSVRSGKGGVGDEQEPKKKEPKNMKENKPKKDAAKPSSGKPTANAAILNNQLHLFPAPSRCLTLDPSCCVGRANSNGGEGTLADPSGRVCHDGGLGV